MARWLNSGLCDFFAPCAWGKRRQREEGGRGGGGGGGVGDIGFLGEKQCLVRQVVLELNAERMPHQAKRLGFSKLCIGVVACSSPKC